MFFAPSLLLLCGWLYLLCLLFVLQLLLFCGCLRVRFCSVKPGCLSSSSQLWPFCRLYCQTRTHTHTRLLHHAHCGMQGTLGQTSPKFGPESAKYRPTPTDFSQFLGNVRATRGLTEFAPESSNIRPNLARGLAESPSLSRRRPTPDRWMPNLERLRFQIRPKLGRTPPGSVWFRPSLGHLGRRNDVFLGSLIEQRGVTGAPREVWFGIKDIVITTYETVTTADEFFMRHLWRVVVLDEAHKIKNQGSRVRLALDKVPCCGRVLLTGTPLQNNLGDRGRGHLAAPQLR